MDTCDRLGREKDGSRSRRSGVNGYDVTSIYDPLGNRLVKIDGGTRTTSTFDAANQTRYAQEPSGRTTFAYDGAGNQFRQLSPSLQITTSVFDYEGMNRATVLPAGSRVTSTYDADRRRVARETASGTRKFIHDGQNILEETDGSNLAQAIYTLEPAGYGNLISQRQLQSGTWTPLQYVFDALGNTDSLLDSAQVITDTHTYHAFGTLKASTGTTTNFFTWIGQRGYFREIETGEYALGLRQYQPNQARFKGPDPLSWQPDPNTYRYAENNPINRTDPSGMVAADDGGPINFPCVGGDPAKGEYPPAEDAYIRDSSARFERMYLAKVVEGARNYARFDVWAENVVKSIWKRILAFIVIGEILSVFLSPAAVLLILSAVGLALSVASLLVHLKNLGEKL
jgi:RHS repeat-associated protein